MAFETARSLRRLAHLEPFHLFAGASPAPQLPWLHSPLRSLPEDTFLREVEQRYGGVPREILADPEMRALAEAILRADFSMVETYSHAQEAPLSCGITVFGGTRDHMVKRAELEVWRQQTLGQFRLQMLNGDHLFLRSCRRQLVQAIAGVLETCFEVQENVGFSR